MNAEVKYCDILSLRILLGFQVEHSMDNTIINDEDITFSLLDGSILISDLFWVAVKIGYGELVGIVSYGVMVLESVASL